MGHDYSYSQPSSSSAEIDITALLEEEVQGYLDEAQYADEAQYTDEAQSTYNDLAGPVQYPPQPESDDGIPTICYCGAEPVVATSYTHKDTGRRYFTCNNVDDGDCHICKWWYVAVMEEMRDFDRQVRQLKDQVNVSEQKLVLVEKTVDELSKKKSGVKLMGLVAVCLLVLIGLVFFFLRAIDSKASPGSNENVLPL